MQAFLAPLAELAEYKEIFGRRKKNSGVLQITGCVNSQKTHLMYALSDGCYYKIIAFSSDEKGLSELCQWLENEYQEFVKE